jgi:multiple antibiotic resistance protein
VAIDLAQAIQFFLVTLSSIFFLVDPFALVPTFLAMTAASSQGHRRAMARRASFTCFFLLTGFALAGTLVFDVLGITMPAFKIAGGIILLLIGIDMVQARRPATNETEKEADEGAHKADIGIVPLGMPMLAGPGAISTVMVLIGSAETPVKFGLVILALGITAGAAYLILSAAERVRKVLGETGIHVLSRIMGMLLMALAVQFMVDGLAALGFASGRSR